MFHEIEREHLFRRRDVSCMVFWKDNLRNDGVHNYMRVILVDEEVHLYDCL